MTRMRTAIARTLFHTGRMADRLSRVMVYCLAGTRTLAQMQADHRRTWDRFYESHPSSDSRLLPWEEDYLGRFVAPGSNVLLIGCGSGRDLLALLERGCVVTGVDPSVKALAIADRSMRDRGLRATLVEGFFEDVPIVQTFQTIIFSYYCYGAIPTRPRRLRALRKSASLLAREGRVIVSYPARIPRPRPVLVRLGQLAGALTRSDWRLEAGDVVSDNRECDPSFSFMHAFEHGELEREAADADFEPICHRVADDNSAVVVMRQRM